MAYVLCMYFIWWVPYVADFEFSAIDRGFELNAKSNPPIYTLMDAQLAMYLIWRRDINRQRRQKEYIAKCYTFTEYS